MSAIARVPAVKPITIGPFTLTTTGLDVRGRPSFAEYKGVGDFIERTHKAAGWWLADWITYGESRDDWRGSIDQLIDAEVVSEATVKQYRYVAKNVPKSRRFDEVSFSHHIEVAGLDAAEQVPWLKRAAEEGWSQRELRQQIRAAKRTKVIDGQAPLEGMYRVLYADPPWLYGDSGATADGSLGKAARHYPAMSIEALCKLPVEAHAMPNAVLFLWITAPMLLTNPGPRDVIEAWGFTYKSGAVWNKVLGNFGHYFHVQHEHLAVCTRGSCLPDVPVPSPASVITERRSGQHSEKPESVRQTIQRLYTRGPYLELFGRKRVDGWDVFGNDARLWTQEASA